MRPKSFTTAEIRELIADLRKAASLNDKISDGMEWPERRAADALEYLLQFIEWRPKSEAPRDGTPVLLCDARTSTPDLANVRWAVWAGGLWRDGTVEARGQMVGLVPTHFMHLPPPPQEQEKGSE